jgi:hypothetical protein
LKTSSIEDAEMTRVRPGRGAVQLESPGAIAIHGAPYAPTLNHFESSKLLPWLMFCALVAGLALGLSVLAVVLGQQSEREARLAQYDLQILRAKVEAVGVKTDDH